MIGVVVVSSLRKKEVALLANSLLKLFVELLWLCLYDIRHLFVVMFNRSAISLWDLFSYRLMAKIRLVCSGKVSKVLFTISWISAVKISLGSSSSRVAILLDNSQELDLKDFIGSHLTNLLISKIIYTFMLQDSQNISWYVYVWRQSFLVFPIIHNWFNDKVSATASSCTYVEAKWMKRRW